MALTDKAYTSIHSKTGDAKDLLKDEFDAGYLGKISDIPSKEPALTALVYQVGLLQDELDYLRTEISDNKDKTVLALGTSGTTALAGDTNIVTIGSSTTIAFGDMVTVPPKGKTPASYSIVMTVVNGGVTKTVKLTLA